jgi:hypothetical protein
MADWVEGLKALNPIGIAAGFIQDHQNRQERRGAQNEAKWEAQKNREFQAAQADIDRKQQMEFAKHGLTWKIEQAKKYGINPLVAAGAQGQSSSPVHVGGAQANSLEPFQGSAFDKAGQGISRAISAQMTDAQKKEEQLRVASMELDLENKFIDNAYKAKLLENLEKSRNFPSLTGGGFMDGQGNSGTLVNQKPKERVISQPGRPAQEAGWVPDVGYSRTDTGLTPVVPESLSESLEDDIIGKALWRIRNQLVPNFTESGKPAKSQLPPGHSHWGWDRLKQEWVPMKPGGKSSYQIWHKRGQKLFDHGREKFKEYKQRGGR